MNGGPGIPGWFIAAFILIAIVGVGSTIARAAYLKSRGVNPLFPKEQIEAAIVNSELLRPPSERTPGPGTVEPARPPKTIEQRLTELDDLHSRGVISDEELRTARAKLLTEG